MKNVSKNFKNVCRTFFAFVFIIFALNSGYGLCKDLPESGKVAVVDYDLVAKGSREFDELKKYQAHKTEELQNFMLKAQADVEKEKDEAKKRAMQDKYNKEYRAKRAEIENHYSAKIKEIDNMISSKIHQKAKAMGYTLVLTKNGVLYGGEDITNIIREEVK